MHRIFIIFGCICGAFVIAILATSPDTRNMLGNITPSISSQPTWVNSPLDLSATMRKGCRPPVQKKVRCIPLQS